MPKTTKKVAAKTTKKIAKKDFTYNTPISAVEELYGFKTNLPPNTKFGDAVKRFPRRRMVTVEIITEVL